MPRPGPSARFQFEMDGLRNRAIASCNAGRIALTMPPLPTIRIGRTTLNSNPVDLVFPFLAPSLQCTRNTPHNSVARFSTSPVSWKRRDNNPNRGVSALRHTGPRKRQTMSVSLEDLPKPVKPERAVEGDTEHGLWGFFRDQKLMRTPADEAQHGRNFLRW